MRNQEIHLRKESAADVTTAIDADGDGPARRLGSRYAPPVDEAVEVKVDGKPVVIDHRLFLNDLRNDLEAHAEMLAEAEDSYLRKVAVVVELRRRSRAQTKELGGTFQQVRHVVESLYGSDRGFELAVVSGKTPRVPSRLAEQVAQTVDFLENPPVDLPKLDLKGAKIVRATLAEDLKPGLRKLLALNAELKRRRKEARGLRGAKEVAKERFDRVYNGVSRTVENLFRLVEMDAVADRVRPKGRLGRRLPRNGGSEEPPAEESEAESAAEAEPADAQPDETPAPAEASADASPAEEVEATDS